MIIVDHQKGEAEQLSKPDLALLPARCGCVEVVPVGVVEGHPRQHQRQLVRPLRLVSEAGKRKIEIVLPLKKKKLSQNPL